MSTNQVRLKGKVIRETRMILNHKAAIEMLIEEADQDRI
jgi:hypothetical protein